jgi:hypothetical protein
MGSGWEVDGKWMGSGGEVKGKWMGSGGEVEGKWRGSGWEVDGKWMGSGGRWMGSGGEVEGKWRGSGWWLGIGHKTFSVKLSPLRHSVFCMIVDFLYVEHLVSLHFFFVGFFVATNLFTWLISRR